jgi:hypothetical protein
MAQTAFFLADVLRGNIAAGSGFTTELPASNVSDDSPGIQAKQLEGLSYTGTFETGSSNKWIDIDEGAGEVGVAMPSQQWTQGPAQIAAALQSELNNAVGLADTYTVTWLNGVFAIGSSGTFAILWKTGSHGSDNSANNIGEELGFDTSADTGTAGSHTGTEKRYSTGTSLVFDLGTATEIHGIAWYAEGGDDGATVDYDDVVFYVDTSLRGFTRDAWIDASSTAITLSARPSTEAANMIQTGFQDPDTATARRWAFVSWRHFDESSDHRIGLCKAAKATYDTTNARTIGPLQGHQPADTGEARNVGNYYPPPGTIRWQATLPFIEWEVASWREVFEPLIEHGKRTAMLWVEDFATLKANGAAAKLASVKAGTTLWAVVQDTSGGDATGQQDLYRTSRAMIEQLP